MLHNKGKDYLYALDLFREDELVLVLKDRNQLGDYIRFCCESYFDKLTIESEEFPGNLKFLDNVESLIDLCNEAPTYFDDNPEDKASEIYLKYSQAVKLFTLLSKNASAMQMMREAWRELRARSTKEG
jgi:hypothetical protein